MNWKLLVPRYRSFKAPQGQVSSFRWLGWGCDHVKAKAFIYLQWGRRPPLRFYCKKLGKSYPAFLVSEKFRKFHTSERSVVGLTHKPFEFAKFWRRTDGITAIKGRLR